MIIYYIKTLKCNSINYDFIQNKALTDNNYEEFIKIDKDTDFNYGITEEKEEELSV